MNGNVSDTPTKLMNALLLGGWQQEIATIPPYAGVPTPALYLPLLRQLVELAETFFDRLIPSQFLCSFKGKYFYFFTGEMHIC